MFYHTKEELLLVLCHKKHTESENPQILNNRNQSKDVKFYSGIDGFLNFHSDFFMGNHGILDF
jgi:hypothetical protein